MCVCVCVWIVSSCNGAFFSSFSFYHFVVVVSSLQVGRCARRWAGRVIFRERIVNRNGNLGNVVWPRLGFTMCFVAECKGLFRSLFRISLLLFLASFNWQVDVLRGMGLGWSVSARVVVFLAQGFGRGWLGGMHARAMPPLRNYEKVALTLGDFSILWISLSLFPWA